MWTLTSGVYGVVDEMNKFMWTAAVLWRKGTAWPLSERGHEGQREPKRESTPAWTGFYCFSGHITSRMVLIYYAQVHCR